MISEPTAVRRVSEADDLLPGLRSIVERVERIGRGGPPRTVRRLDSIANRARGDVAGLARQNQIGLLQRFGGMARPVLDVHQRDARIGVGGRLRQHLLQDRTRLVVSTFPREHQTVEQPRVHVTRRLG